MEKQNLINYLNRILSKAILNIASIGNEFIIYVKHNYIIECLTVLKYHSLCQYKVLIDLCGADYPTREKRFDVVYNLLSVFYNNRIRLKLTVDEITPVSSVTSLFAGAGWAERETWDMFGVFFVGNRDLRRILTDYGFEGFPLRKDFPLSGYVEVRYDDVQKKVVVEPIEMMQQYRAFDFLTPWSLNSDEFKKIKINNEK